MRRRMTKNNGGSQMIPGFSLSISGDALTRLLKQRKLPHVVLHMADTATLFVNGVRASTGPIKQATDVIRKIGYGPGDEFQMHHPNGEQLMVRL
jgi:hypothetical protein